MKKKLNHDGYMGVKIEEQLKKTFIQVCKTNDTIASQEIRKFIKDYIQKNRQLKMDL